MMAALETLATRWIGRRATVDPAALAAIAGKAPVAVVTGGSEGIGLAIAEILARRGMQVLIIARRKDKIDAALVRLAGAGKGRSFGLSVDLTARDAIATLDRELADRNLYADLVINSAGVGLAEEFCTHDAAAVGGLVDLNVRALTQLTHHFLPAMLARASGGILNIASLGGFGPGPGQAAYYASKAYVVSLTIALAHETRGRGVRIAVASPGPVATGFHAKMGAEGARYRRLLPALSAETVAKASLMWFALGRRSILMNPLDMAMAWIMRAAPWPLVMPVIGWLLAKPRRS
jgi:short-subunit dehydrogenase